GTLLTKARKTTVPLIASDSHEPLHPETPYDSVTRGVRGGGHCNIIKSWLKAKHIKKKKRNQRRVSNHTEFWFYTSYAPAEFRWGVTALSSAFRLMVEGDRFFSKWYLKKVRF
ncbi:MAG: hypothetical protein WAW92_00085, partial [Minisyncoccia bacterium]